MLKAVLLLLGMVVLYAAPAAAQSPCWWDAHAWRWRCPWDERMEREREHWGRWEHHEERERARHEWCEHHPNECR